jgi:class 3 adenylate cyclase
MCCANLIKDQPDHAKRIALFSMDIIETAKQTLLDGDDESKGYVSIRVGFHSGPVVARVVGSRTPKYSVFGGTKYMPFNPQNRTQSLFLLFDRSLDTVNTASRMESTSFAGMIQCSDVAASLLTDDNTIEVVSRGLREIKGKGEMETYFVRSHSRVKE